MVRKFRIGEDVIVKGAWKIFGGHVIKEGLFRVAVLHTVYNIDQDYEYNDIKWFRKGRVFHAEDVAD